MRNHQHSSQTIPAGWLRLRPALLGLRGSAVRSEKEQVIAPGSAFQAMLRMVCAGSSVITTPANPAIAAITVMAERNEGNFWGYDAEVRRVT